MTNSRPNTLAQVRAPLRWAGSKRRSLPVLLHYLPAEISHYIEPFAGSGCLAFAAKPQLMVLGDINSQLIEFYTYLRDDPSGLHNIYSSFTRDPSTYYCIREAYNSAQPSLNRAAQFLYLNRHCFNGIYRVNGSGKFNVPWGGDKAGKNLTLDELENAANALINAKLECEDFEQVVKNNLEPNSFVYLDPPYASDEARVFREYHQESFATNDWSRLARILKAIDEAGAKFLVSYAAPHSFAKEIKEWNTTFLDVTRNVGGFKASRRKHREFIAANFELQQVQ